MLKKIYATATFFMVVLCLNVEAGSIERRAKLLPSNIVPYKLDKLLSRSRKASIIAGIEMWNDVTKKTGIRLVPFNSRQHKYSITFEDDGSGESSFTPALLKIQIGRNSSGTVAHEIGHALGLEHEHKRADRDNYISVNFNKIGRNWVDQYLSSKAYLNCGVYDYKSIMHYSSGDEISSPVRTGNRNALSQGDINTIAAAYNKKNDRPTAGDDKYSTKGRLAVFAGNWKDAIQGILYNDGDFDGDKIVARVVSKPSNGVIKDFNGFNGTFVYTPNPGFQGTDSFEYVVNDGHIDSTPAKVTINVKSNGSTEPTTPTRVHTINFKNSNILTYRRKQDKTPKGFRVDRDELTLIGNTWKCITFNKTITSKTVLKFDFYSSVAGDFQGIGFSKYLDMKQHYQRFNLRGNKVYKGINHFNSYSKNLGKWHTYEIPVGLFYSGNFKYLFFINDHDVSSPTASCKFRNISVYEKK